MKRIVGVFAAALCLLIPVQVRAQNAVKSWRHADAETVNFTLRLARRAFDTWVLQHRVIAVPHNLPPLLKLRSGVFISTSFHGAPRTCMGTLYPAEGNIASEIIHNAVISAGSDHRFAPVKPKELKTLKLIVSIVSRPDHLDKSQLSAIDPLRDGLAVRYQHRFGVVLNGETRRLSTMEKWGRIRAKATADDAVDYYKLDVVRFMKTVKKDQS